MLWLYVLIYLACGSPPPFIQSIMNAERNSSFKTPLPKSSQYKCFEMKVFISNFWPWVSVFNGTTGMCSSTQIHTYFVEASGRPPPGCGMIIGEWYIIYLCTTLAGLVGCYGVASAFLRMMMLGFRRFHPLLLLMAMAYIPDEKVNFLLYTLLLPGCAKIFAH